MAPKTYVVQAGDTMGEIAKKFYDTASMRAVEFLVKSNRDMIKNKDFVVAGTEIQVPELPAEFFEPAAGFTVATLQSTVRTVGTEDLRRDQAPPEGDATRHAPKALKRVDAPPQKAERGSDAAQSEFRWYEVKPKDTLSSIAKKQLGSSAHWREIHKLNADIDPMKMKPGTRIKLPKKRPVSDASALRRVEA
jgi:nucleoid-associated protein YgaU